MDYDKLSPTERKLLIADMEAALECSGIPKRVFLYQVGLSYATWYTWGRTGNFGKRSAMRCQQIVAFTKALNTLVEAGALPVPHDRLMWLGLNSLLSSINK